MNIIDCTLRDGGYHNNWDFPLGVVNAYLQAMAAAGVSIVELGLRSLKNESFRGACAFTTDDYLHSLDLPPQLCVGVMFNASELLTPGLTPDQVLSQLFPRACGDSPVTLVRIACHKHELTAALSAVRWLKARGYQVGLNLMQIADSSADEIQALASQASGSLLDVLYFADSTGSMNPDDVARVVGWFRSHWGGPMGIHTHDNLGLALANTLRARDVGVQWLDATVTGMGRGPGNAKTEYLVLELADERRHPCNMTPLLTLMDTYFNPLQRACGWGANPYYYLAGKYGIHPTYIQEMMSDSRYSEEDMLTVIDYLRDVGGKQFSYATLGEARAFYKGPPRGLWSPAQLIGGRDVLLLGTGPGVAQHRAALETFIASAAPFVIALNTQSAIDPSLIDARVACHPLRLLADCKAYASLPQPLITPVSMLPASVRDALSGNTLLDFGISVEPRKLDVSESHCTLPTLLVFAYALAVAASGKAPTVYLAGFDGYGSDDPRNQEIEEVFSAYAQSVPELTLCAVTPTRYALKAKSIYGSGR